MTRFSRHGWRHERQPEHVFRAAAVLVLLVFAVLLIVLAVHR